MQNFNKTLTKITYTAMPVRNGTLTKSVHCEKKKMSLVVGTFVLQSCRVSRHILAQTLDLNDRLFSTYQLDEDLETYRKKFEN